jgi:cytochrome c oxidase cbb3-type subunit 1
LITVWFGLVGLASVFYFVPKLVNRELPSQHLALLTFWSLILFGSWGGIPRVAPVPAWIPTLVTVASVLTILTLISLKLNLGGVLECKWSKLFGGSPSLQFIGVGIVAFFIGGMVNVLGPVLDPNNALNFTWLGRARTELQVYGFFSMTSFGAIYYIVPLITGIELCPKFVKLHFRLAVFGLLLIVVPLAIGGLLEAAKLRDATVPFADVIKGTLPFLRITTVGELSLLAGHVVLLLNLVALIKQLYFGRLQAAYANATADVLRSAEVKP